MYKKVVNAKYTIAYFR